MNTHEPHQTVDLTNCDREPIHMLGRVQAFGCLLAVSTDWIIVHASSNVDQHLGWMAEDMIGKRFVDFFSEEIVHFLRTRFQVLATQAGAARVYAVDVLGDGRLFDIAIHRTARQLIFEFMPRQHSPERRDDTALVQALIALVQRHGTVSKASSEAARALQALTGMDRVMVYRFEPDGSGTVIAESLRGLGERFLGLRYPASDIPKQARELYKRSLIRIISDVDGETFPIIPGTSPEGQPLDLSMAVTRAVSNIHLEYLRNMGVAASMSVSILRRGELWGLLACHHNEPILIDYERRSAIELFAQLFTYELAQIETASELEDMERARSMHDLLTSQISSGETLFDLFPVMAAGIEPVIPFDGMAIFSNGVYRAKGSAPTEEEFLGLARFLNTAQSSEVFAVDEIGAIYPKADSFADRVAGVLALPVSRMPRDYLVLFRREMSTTVTWAGNPEKPVETGPNGARLTPRKSFDAWQEVVRGRASPWKPSEKRAADALRVTLLEVVLKITDEASASQKRAEAQQELLIAELNHRVRNILNLIRGLVSQSRGGAASLDAYTKVLDDRIHALALAHDQLTQKAWSWVSLKNLISNEIEAFLAGKSDRIAIHGDDIDLSPTAFTSMALVVHELVTNSVKYGALGNNSGRVTIDIATTADGAATIHWVERGGPPVQAPTRRGFGTTIIQHSVPFELKGTADVEYKVSGLEARFMIPSVHVTASLAPEQPKIAATVATAAVSSEPWLTGAVLVVEDNLIISMDAADMLYSFGANPVLAASSVDEALKLLEEQAFEAAVLDVNLGSETSLKVAERCVELGIPTILATGYGLEGQALTGFPEMLVIRKPYTLESLRAALLELHGSVGE